MHMIEVVLKPHTIDDVKARLAGLGILGGLLIAVFGLVVSGIVLVSLVSGP